MEHTHGSEVPFRSSNNMNSHLPNIPALNTDELYELLAAHVWDPPAVADFDGAAPEQELDGFANDNNDDLRLVQDAHVPFGDGPLDLAVNNTPNPSENVIVPADGPSASPAEQSSREETEEFEFLADVAASLPRIPDYIDLDDVFADRDAARAGAGEAPIPNNAMPPPEAMPVGGAVDSALVEHERTPAADFSAALTPRRQPPMLLANPPAAHIAAHAGPTVAAARALGPLPVQFGEGQPPASPAPPLRRCLWEGCTFTGSSQDTHWRTGPMGRATLCNKHGLRYSGSLAGNNTAMNAKRRARYAERKAVAQAGGKM